MSGNSFDKIRSSINRGITTISVKTSSSIEKTKIKTHIESLNMEIENIMLHIGKEAYSIWNSNSEDYSKLSKEFLLIQSKMKEIESLTVELNLIDQRNEQILGHNMIYSPGEGNEGVVCQNCNTQYAQAINFCPKCGSQIKK